MTLTPLLNTLEQSGITLALIDNKIRINAPKGVMTEALLAQIRSAKPQLTAHLKTMAAPVFPQSFGQRQLWFLDKLSPKNPFYNNPIALQLCGELDPANLQAAINDVAARHSILRSCYFDQNGAPSMRVSPVGPVPFQIVNISDADQDKSVRHAVETEARTGFDLANEWPLRSTLMRLNEKTHVWLLTVHHIAADGWSVSLLIGEIAAHYQARCLGGEADVPRLAWQYSDYALHQRACRKTRAYKEKKDYWRQQLADGPNFLSLPTDRPRPAVQTYAGAHHSFNINRESQQKLGVFCKAQKTTPFAALMALHVLIMAKNSGQDDIFVGTPLAGRNRQEVEPLIGHFINSVVLRGKIDWQSSFKDLVAQVQKDVLDAMEHGDFPFEAVVEAVNPPRSQSYAPLFQNMLIYQNTPQGALDFEGVKVAALPTDSGTSKYDLTVEIFKTETGLKFGLEYNTDLFEKARVEGWGRQYAALLAWLLENPDQPLREASIMDPEEADKLRVDWGTGRVQPLYYQAAHKAFEARVDQMPEQTAVVFKDESISFRALDEAANQLAQLLIAQGVQAGDLIGICCARTIHFGVAMLAVLKTGAAYVPMDPDYPPARLADMLKDCAPKLVLADEQGRQALPSNTHTLSPKTDANAPLGRPDIQVNGSDIAYVLYTSGSTGRPKGVEVPHRALANLCQWMEEDFPADEDAGAVLQKTSQGFDASIWEFWWPLTSGRTMVIASEEAATEPGRLAALINTHNICAAQFVPATLDLFTTALPEGGCPSLRHVFCGGGVLENTQAHALYAALPAVSLWNVYGPTEACVDATISRIPPEESTTTPPIGHPIHNTRIYVLDANMRPVPQGVRGEIFIGGMGLARGYLGQAEKTSECFFHDPMAPGERLYRTGDLASWRPDGQLVFAGRSDDQIKHNGCRIEPGDVEAALCVNGASAALVLVRAGQLLAYVTGDPPNRAALSSRLPAYMIPDVIISLAEFPRLPNGKIDRQSLPEAVAPSLENVVNQNTPRDRTEMALLRIWSRVLTREHIGIRDNFFDLGGSSIASIKVVHEIQKDMGHQVPLRQVIAYPTIEELAAYIRGLGAEAPAQDDGVIHFKKGHGQGRLICVHPAGGTGFCYLPLSQAMPEGMAVLALQSSGLAPKEPRLTDVKEMATMYLARLDGQIEGPLVLTGLSFGGLVAHEMGRVLAAQGRSDVTVVLLDTQGTEEASERQKIDRVDLAEFREKLVRFNGTYPGIEDAQIERYFQVYNTNRLAVRDYEVPPTSARTVFIQAHDALPRPYLHRVRRFWKARAKGGFAVHLVRGGHWDMLETDELKRVKKVILQEYNRIAERRA